MFPTFAFAIFSIILVYAPDLHEDGEGMNFLQSHVIGLWVLATKLLVMLVAIEV